MTDWVGFDLTTKLHLVRQINLRFPKHVDRNAEHIEAVRNRVTAKLKGNLT